MSELERKMKQLEEAMATAQSVLALKESDLSSASEALNKVKSKLRSLDPEAQRMLQLNDTELPELMSAELFARTEYDTAKARYETNQKYLLLIRERVEGKLGYR